MSQADVPGFKGEIWIVYDSRVSFKLWQLWERMFRQHQTAIPKEALHTAAFHKKEVWERLFFAL